jgi:hypothetical protein
MLCGLKCEELVNLFAEQRVSLEDFLTADDEKLKNIGVEFPFKRGLILQGLMTFHEKKWRNSSMKLFKTEQKME